MRNKIVYLVFITLLLLQTGCLKKEKKVVENSKQLIEVKVSVDKPSVKIGDIIRYTIKVDAASNVWFYIPDFTESVGGLAVYNWNKSEKAQLPNGRVIQTQTSELETYLVGDYEIPATNIIYVTNGKTNYISGTPIYIEVTSVATTNDTFAGIRDIKGPVDIQALIKKKSKMFLIVIAAALLTTLIIIILVRKRKEVKKVVIPPTPAHIIAYNALKNLDEKHLIEKNHIKAFYYELSNILRHYIEDRFTIKAPERTTEEFLHELNNDKTFPEEYRALLKKFLIESDLVKFANYNATGESAHNAEDKTVEFIDKTKEARSPPRHPRGAHA